MEYETDDTVGAIYLHNFRHRRSVFMKRSSLFWENTSYIYINQCLYILAQVSILKEIKSY